MGSLVGERQLETVTRHVDEAVAKGATVVAGGVARPDIGPLLLRADHPRRRRGADGRLRRGDLRPGRLRSTASRRGRGGRAAPTPPRTASTPRVWTKDGRRGRAVAARLRTGTVNINEGYAPAYGSVQSPMGGMKDSGLGRRHGSEGILKYTEAQTVAQQRLLPLAPSFGMDDEKYAAFMSRSLQGDEGVPAALASGPCRASPTVDVLARSQRGEHTCPRTSLPDAGTTPDDDDATTTTSSSSAPASAARSPPCG